MSVVRKEGKDTIIFASKEDHASPSKVNLPEPEPGPGLILPNGEINWNCPCLGGMATGPCGLEFREAFSCFHYSAAEPKGSDCYDAFKTMQTCMSEYPALYGNKETDMDDLDGGESPEGGGKGNEIAAEVEEDTDDRGNQPQGVKDELTNVGESKNQVQQSTAH